MKKKLFFGLKQIFSQISHYFALSNWKLIETEIKYFILKSWFYFFPRSCFCRELNVREEEVVVV